MSMEQERHFPSRNRGINFRFTVVLSEMSERPLTGLKN